MALTKAIAGGLLSGVGGGMIAQAEDRRQEALERARELRRSMEREDDRNFTRMRDFEQREQQLTDRADERNYQGGLIRSTDVDADGNVIGITGSGETKPLDYKRNPGLITRRGGSAADAGGLSAGDKRIIEAAAKPLTNKDMDGNERTDWTAVADKLRQQGRADLAQLVAPVEGGGIDREDPLWIEAGREADAWVKEQAGWLSSDKTDFEQYGGNRAEAKRQKQMEIYEQLSGKKAPGAQQPAAPAEARGTIQRPAGGEGPAAQQGMAGATSEATEAARPKSKAEYDALPSGTPFYDPDGNLRIKP